MECPFNHAVMMVIYFSHGANSSQMCFALDDILSNGS